MRHHISLEVRSARLFEFIMMDGGPGATPPGSGVQGAAAPSWGQEIHPKI